MGLEYVVLAFLVLFFFGGLVTPVLVWAGLTESKRRRLKAGLAQLGATQVEDVAGPTADVPATLSFLVGDQLIRAEALLRSGEPVWHVHLPVERSDFPIEFALLDSAWGRAVEAAKAMTPRPLAAGDSLDGMELRFGARVAGTHEPDDAGATRKVHQAFRQAGGKPSHFLQCVLHRDVLVVEGARTQLTEGELMAWVDWSLRFSVALGCRVKPRTACLPVQRPPTRVAGARSGNPVGFTG